MTNRNKMLNAGEERLASFKAAQSRAASLMPPEKLAQIATIQRAMGPALAIEEKLRPFTEMQERWKSLSFQTPAWVEDLQRTSRAIAGALTPFVERMEEINRRLAPMLEAFSRNSSLCQRVEDAGWLPHYTVPFGTLDEVEDEDIDHVLADHYRQNWDAVRMNLTQRVDAYAVDDEAKSVFFDALSAHEAGLFRATPRILFPEIERVARNELHGRMKGETSQRALRQAAEELGLNDVEPGGLYGFRLFEKLFDHLYASAETPEAIEAIARDAVPNRHAAMHGLVAYNSLKSSISMLVMADFLYQVICAVKVLQNSTETHRAAKPASLSSGKPK